MHVDPLIQGRGRERQEVSVGGETLGLVCVWCREKKLWSVLCVGCGGCRDSRHAQVPIQKLFHRNRAEPRPFWLTAPNEVIRVQWPAPQNASDPHDRRQALDR